jgi:hypothetical protein
MRRALALVVVFSAIIGSHDALAVKGESKKAAEIAKRALKHYRAGELKEAAELFLEAYRISKRSAQLRNAAKAYEEGGMLDESLALWERYQKDPDTSADERAEADAHKKLIAEKKRNEQISRSAEDARIAAEAARKDAEAARQRAEEVSKAGVPARDTDRNERASIGVEAPAPSPKEAGSPVAGYVLCAGGGAAAVAGVVVWFLARGRLSTLDQKLATKDPSGLITGITPDAAQSEVSGINTMRVASGVLVSAGAVALVSGLIYTLTADD